MFAVLKWVWSFLDTPPSFALIASIVGGAIFTAAVSQLLHRIINQQFRWQIDENDRVIWIAVVVGICERAVLTTFAIWISSGAATFAGAMLAVKAAASWGSLAADSKAGRSHFFVTIIGSLASILWALGWGIWAKMG